MLSRRNVKAYAESFCGISDEDDLSRLCKTLNAFMWTVVRGAEQYAMHCNRKTIMLRDVSHALWDHGIAACEPVAGTGVGGRSPICKTAHSFLSEPTTSDGKSQAKRTRRKSVGGTAGSDPLRGNPSFCGGLHNASQCGEVSGICLTGGGNETTKKTHPTKKHARSRAFLFLNGELMRKHVARNKMRWNLDALWLIDDSIRYKLKMKGGVTSNR